MSKVKKSSSYVKIDQNVLETAQTLNRMEILRILDAKNMDTETRRTGLESQKKDSIQRLIIELTEGQIQGPA